MIKKLRSSPSGKLRELSPPNSILWATDGSGDVETWDEVMDVVRDNDTPITVWLVEAATYVIPAGFHDVKGLVFQAPRTVLIYATVTLNEGTRLHQCGGIEGGVQLIGASTTTPCMSFDHSGTAIPHILFRIAEIAQIINNGSVPMIQVPAGEGLALIVERLGIVGSGTSPIVQAVSGFAVMMVADMALSIPNNWAIGDAGSTVAYLHDGSLFFPTTAGFGSLINIPFGQDGGSGPTSFRPIGIFQPPKTGCAYWDTTLGKMIWYNGTVWVDATGAPA
jgi:hypothetical protein